MRHQGATMPPHRHAMATAHGGRLMLQQMADSLMFTCADNRIGSWVCWHGAATACGRSQIGSAPWLARMPIYQEIKHTL